MKGVSSPPCARLLPFISLLLLLLFFLLPVFHCQSFLHVLQRIQTVLYRHKKTHFPFTFADRSHTICYCILLLLFSFTVPLISALSSLSLPRLYAFFSPCLVFLSPSLPPRLWLSSSDTRAWPQYQGQDQETPTDQLLVPVSPD